MGVYFESELQYIGRRGLQQMKEIHMKDLKCYHKMDDYPNRQRDIKETEENINILSRMISTMPSDRPISVY